jgi:plastocyanin
MVRALGIAASAAVLFLVPSCGSDKADSTATTVGQGGTNPSTTTASTPSSSTGAAPAPGEIDIVDFEFSPRDLTVARGEAVTWRNQDPYSHWVVSTQADVLDSGELSQAQAYSKTFSQAGTYTYYCNIHNYMKATVTVR